MELTYSIEQHYSNPVPLKHISHSLRIIAVVRVIELNKLVFLARLHKQRALLDYDHSLIGKSCSSCGKMLTLNSFYKDKASFAEKTTSCKSCRARRGRQFRIENPNYHREYTKQHAAQFAVYHKRRELKRQRCMELCFPDDQQYLIEVIRQKQCAITGLTENLTVDHIMPVTQGRWGNTAGNLMPLYAPLNQSKGNKNVFEWAEQITQGNLDILLPESMNWSVEYFREQLMNALTDKAAEKGLTLKQYRSEYYKEYGGIEYGCSSSQH